MLAVGCAWQIERRMYGKLAWLCSLASTRAVPAIDAGGEVSKIMEM
jgi:hypothetical protein